MTETFTQFVPRLARFFRRCRKDTSDAGLQFNQLALDLFQLQFSGVPAYRRVCEARDIQPDRIKEWWQIPALPANAFKDFELTSVPAASRIRVFHSSGTTQHRPSRHFHSQESLPIYEASLWPWFQKHLLPGDCDRLSFLAFVPPPSQAPHSSLVHMLETVRNAFPWRRSDYLADVDEAGAWRLQASREIEALSACTAAGEAVLLLGTAFSFVHLLDFLMASKINLELPKGSRILETGGYKGRSRAMAKAELRALLQEHLGVSNSNIISEYGMSELSSQAYDGTVSSLPLTTPYQSRIFHFPPWARVRVLSPETGHEVREGETGLVHVLDLANVFSVAALQTEDLAIRCGQGFELVGRAAHSEPRGCSLMAR